MEKINYIEKCGIVCMLVSIAIILLSLGYNVPVSLYGATTYVFVVGMVFFLKPNLLNWKIMKGIKFLLIIFTIIVLIELLMPFVLR